MALGSPVSCAKADMAKRAKAAPITSDALIVKLQSGRQNITDLHGRVLERRDTGAPSRFCH